MKGTCLPGRFHLVPRISIPAKQSIWVTIQPGVIQNMESTVLSILNIPGWLGMKVKVIETSWGYLSDSRRERTMHLVK